MSWAEKTNSAYEVVSAGGRPPQGVRGGLCWPGAPARVLLAEFRASRRLGRLPVVPRVLPPATATTLRSCAASPRSASGRVSVVAALAGRRPSSSAHSRAGDEFEVALAASEITRPQAAAGHRRWPTSLHPAVRGPGPGSGGAASTTLAVPANAWEARDQPSLCSAVITVRRPHLALEAWRGSLPNVGARADGPPAWAECVPRPRWRAAGVRVPARTLVLASKALARAGTCA